MLLPGHYIYTRCIFKYYYVHSTILAYPGSLNTLSLSSMSNTLASPVSLYLSINRVIRSCCDVTSTSHRTRNRALSTMFFRWTCPILPTPNRAAPSSGVEVIWSKWNFLIVTAVCKNISSRRIFFVTTPLNNGTTWNTCISKIYLYFSAKMTFGWRNPMQTLQLAVVPLKALILVFFIIYGKTMFGAGSDTTGYLV